MNFASREKEVEPSGRSRTSLRSHSTSAKAGTPSPSTMARLRPTGSPTSAYRDPGHQGPDSPLPDHEGQEGAAQGRGGIPMACRWSWWWRSSWAWTARSRSRPTASSHSFRNVRNRYGSIRANGRGCPRGWLLGRHGRSLYTYTDEYIESVWWSLKRVADKGLLYKGHKVVPYCPPLRHRSVQPRGLPGL